MNTIANVPHEVPMTPEGYERHERELERLRNDERARLAELLREARLEGPLEDNPALVGLLEEQAELESRIARLEVHLAVARIAPAPRDGRAGIGSAVRVRDVATGHVAEHTLVGPLEGDPARGHVSASAPIGRALLGQRRGATVQVPAPRGPITLEILDIDHTGGSLERAAA